MLQLFYCSDSFGMYFIGPKYIRIENVVQGYTYTLQAKERLIQTFRDLYLCLSATLI